MPPLRRLTNLCVFGISPQGNMKNNYDAQFHRLREMAFNKGYVDYICRRFTSVSKIRGFLMQKQLMRGTV
jgi:hypothetical protein